VAVRTLDADALDFDAVTIERGEILTEAQLDSLDGEYLRYRITDSGVSPRAFPGHPKAVYVASGNEHEESGAISEEPEMRTAQVEKRQRKMVGMNQEVSGPTKYGPQGAAVTFVSWGSTYGPLREAVARLNAEEQGRANMLHLVDLWPFPADSVAREAAEARRLVCVEMNATGQLATLIRASTGREVDDQILRYDGRAFTPEYILDRAD
jgi:2-oxoglutarate ferredoxin oxidoreductase subunit alpha